MSSGRDGVTNSKSLRNMVVLASGRVAPDNPYGGMWSDMVHEAGAIVAPFSISNLLAAPRGHRTVIQLQWPEARVFGATIVARAGRLAALLALLIAARLRGNRVLMTMHNLSAHEQGFLVSLLYLALPSLVTDIHTMTEAGLEDVAKSWRHVDARRIYVIPHVRYECGIDPSGEQRDAVRLLSFGVVRSYKGIDELVDAFELADLDAQLQIVGSTPDINIMSHAIAVAKNDPRILIDMSRPTDEALERYIAASSVVVLPYKRILNSGSAILALSVGRPILVPRTATFTELQSRVGACWVRLYDGDISADALRLTGEVPSGVPDMSWCSREVVVHGIERMLADGAT